MDLRGYMAGISHYPYDTSQAKPLQNASRFKILEIS